MRGIIHQVSISKGGLPKHAVAEAEAGSEGLAGDVQRNRVHHGGPRKALLLVSLEDLQALAGEGFRVGPGSLGENLTVQGINFRHLRSGQRFHVGSAMIELTTLRGPCGQLDIYNDGPGKRIQDRLQDARAKAGDVESPLWARGGFYASVVRPGSIAAGVTIALADQAV